jgi:hypothetical protein
VIAPTRGISIETSTDALELDLLQHLSNEDLVARIEGNIVTACRTLEDLRPLVVEAWRRLDDGQTVGGCTTKNEFAEKILHRSKRSVNYMLGGGNHNRIDYVRADSVQDTVSRPSDWIDYQLSFLDSAQASALFDWANALENYAQETGSCTTQPTHDTIQYGPRQAYLSCVPKEFRVTSSGDIPEHLATLHNKVQNLYRAPFNTIQFNRHWNENSFFAPHSDNMHGDIVMLSLGAHRRFVLRYKHNDRAKTLNRWKAGAIYFDEVLPSGSLLTIYANHQFDLTHEMPTSDEPCGVRISLIWRYLTQSVIKGPLGKGSLMAGAGEYRQAKKDFAFRTAASTPATVSDASKPEHSDISEPKKSRTTELREYLTVRYPHATLRPSEQDLQTGLRRQLTAGHARHRTDRYDISLMNLTQSEIKKIADIFAAGDTPTTPTPSVLGGRR